MPENLVNKSLENIIIEKRSIKAKKVYEIEKIVPIVKSMCEKYGCSVVLDLGCGLVMLSLNNMIVLHIFIPLNFEGNFS